MKSMVIIFCLILGSVSYAVNTDASENDINPRTVDQYIKEIRENMILFVLEKEKQDEYVKQDENGKLETEPRIDLLCYYSSKAVHLWLSFQESNRLLAIESSMQNENKKEMDFKLKETEILVGLEFWQMVLVERVCRSFAGH